MLRPTSNRFAVLDIEVVPCPDTAALAPRAIQPRLHRAALQRIACISLLSGEERGGQFQVEELRTFSLAEHDEADIIGMLDILLPQCRLGNALVTFNGAAHDLRVLMLRACALWMVPLENLAAWTAAPPTLHVDLQRDVYGGPGFTRWSLPDISAALGLAIRQGTLGESIFWLHERERYDEIEARNQINVAATFIAYAAHRSFMTGHDGYLLSAWAEIGRSFEKSHSGTANPLAGHRMVETAKRALEPLPSAPTEDPY